MSDVRLTLEGPLARITLDRPPLNILTIAMLDRLAEAFASASQRADVRLIRLDAVGRAFSAGVDVADHVAERLDAMMASLTRLFEVLDAVEPPTVAVVHGAALGGGCELVLGTDLCFAAERATFGQPEIRLGLFAPPASVLLPRVVGERRALELLLTGEALSAREAERRGLVNAVFDDERFEAEVGSRLERLLSMSGAALRQAKKAVRAARGLDVAAAHRVLERQYVDELMRTADAREGLQAFLAKRPADWKHA